MSNLDHTKGPEIPFPISSNVVRASKAQEIRKMIPAERLHEESVNGTKTKRRGINTEIPENFGKNRKKSANKVRKAAIMFLVSTTIVGAGLGGISAKSAIDNKIRENNYVTEQSDVFINEYMHGNLNQYKNVYDHADPDHNHDWDYSDISENITSYINDYHDQGYVSPQDAMNFAFYVIHDELGDYDSNDIINHYLSNYNGISNIDNSSDFQNFNQYLNDMNYESADEFYDAVEHNNEIYGMIYYAENTQENAYNQLNSNSNGNSNINDFLSTKGVK